MGNPKAFKIKLSEFQSTGEELAYIKNAFDDNWLAAGGSQVETLEQEIEAYLDNVNYAVGLNSGTSAIHLALQLAGVGKDDIVLCQSFTFIASANPITYLGAQPVFIGSETTTWNIDAIALEEAIQLYIQQDKKPKAIIAVHLYGMPYNVEAVTRIAKRYGIAIIEDAAEALGSSYKGQKCGSFGDFSIFSFNGNKIVSSSGGGILLCKRKSDAENAKYLASQAKDDKPYYEHSQIGYNYRMNNLTAAIARSQLKVLEERVQQRRSIQKFYSELFKQRSDITVFKEADENYRANYWLSTILFQDKEVNVSESFRLYLEKNQIESRRLWKPLHLQPVFSTCDYYGNREEEALFKSGICLPSSSNLLLEHKEYMLNILTKYLNA